ncbi:MAG: penicillin-binding protein 1B [Gammaproteobacteria bacterium]
MTTRSSQKLLHSGKRRWLRWLSLILLLLLTGYLGYLNYLVNQRFEGTTWATPSRVYARSLELYSGLSINPGRLQAELNRGLYHPVKLVSKPGQYSVSGKSMTVFLRQFDFPSAVQESKIIRIDWQLDQVSAIRGISGDQVIEIIRVPPLVLGSYYPDSDEDRSLLKFNKIPTRLLKILLLIEDRRFFEHWGINPSAIGRAFLANIKAGKTVQGGSTLTQQLAKNLFLNREKSLTRKINEAILSILLEIRFDKQTILQAYVNEVYLAQHNKIAIHGFAQASRLLFGRTIDQLDDADLALIVGMVKGPSLYNPVKHLKNATKRRNLVLQVMNENGLLDFDAYTLAKNKPIRTNQNIPGINPYPAFLDLVKRQINRHVESDKVSNHGLRIFTTFDPIVQQGLEKGLKSGLKHLGKADLQSAVIITDYLNGDILAMTGDSQVDYPGFNRALLAQRSIGSLIKPLLLYSVLDNRTHLASIVSDQAISIRQSDGKIWSPRNYDRKTHGEITLYQAFVKSYNLPFVHLGINGGLKALANNLNRLNLLKQKNIYPSLLLGTTPMSVFEVAQLYQVIANNGYFTPLTSIREITTAENVIINQTPIVSHQLFDAEKLAQVHRALIGVTEEGTAKYLKSRMPDKILAGKTGTTNDTRDSWFVGFGQQLMAIVWLGMDQNESTGLTGSSGALRIWADIMDHQNLQSFSISANEKLNWKQVNRFNGSATRSGCSDSVLLPFTRHHVIGPQKGCN